MDESLAFSLVALGRGPRNVKSLASPNLMGNVNLNKGSSSFSCSKSHIRLNMTYALKMLNYVEM